MRRIYEFLIDEEDQETGVKTISLVEDPAMESDFIKFNKEERKPKYVSLEKEGENFKQVVAGLAMIPDKLIFRVDPETNEEYYGYFSQETIEKIRNKYHKEMQTSNVNLEHDDKQYVDAYLIESYLLSTQERVDEVKSQGIEEATIGAWYTQFKIEDEEVFKKVLEGEYNGFSIEAFLNRELTKVDASKNNIKEKETKMRKSLIDNLKEKFNNFLESLEIEDEQTESVEESVENKFEEMLVPEENVTAIWGDVGEPVQKRYTNDAGEEVTENIGQGEFVLEDGRTLVVDENSNLIEVRPAEQASEETPAKEEESKEEAPVKEEESKEEIKAEETPVEENNQTETSTEEGLPSGVIDWLDSVAGQFEEGELYLSFLKQDGQWKYGSASTWSDIKMKAEPKDEIENLKNQIKDLEEKLSQPISEPKLTDEEKEDKGSVEELTVYEKIARRKGLPTV